MHRLGPDVSLGDGDVADEIAQSEHSFARRPFDVLRRNALGDLPRPLSNVVEVLQKPFQRPVHVAVPSVLSVRRVDYRRSALDPHRWHRRAWLDDAMGLTEGEPGRAGS